jgi:peptidoglycan/LPS O-acetylase OafA/YrhL
MKDHRILRLALIVACLLLIPLVAMQFDNGVDWSVFDFIVAGILLFGTGLIYELLVRRVVNTRRRAVFAVLLFGALAVIWADLAVGIFNIPGFSGS